MTSPAELRLATFAVPLSGNKGSASMLLGLIDSLRREGIRTDFLAFSYYPQRDKEIAADLPGVRVRAGHPRDLLRLIPLLLLNRLFGRMLPESLRTPYDELAECDLICLVGGTTFADSMLYKVPWNVLAAIPALIVNRPIVLLSQTLGPFNRRLNRVNARWLLSRAVAIHGRGQRSTDYVRRCLGIATARYWPDLSFGLDLSAAKLAPELQKWSKALDRHSEGGIYRMAGLTPNTIVDEKMGRAGMNYAALIAQSIRELDARGYRAVLIPHSYRSGTEKAHNNDLHICREIINLLPPEAKCIFIDEDLSSQALRLLIGRFDLLLASRFHSMVSALAMGVPPLTVGWGDHKYLEVLEEFGVRELYLDFSMASLRAIREKLDWLESHKEEVRRRIASGRDACMRLTEGLGTELVRVSKQHLPRAGSTKALSKL